MSHLTRRDFLRTAVIAGGGFATLDPVELGRRAWAQPPASPAEMAIARWDAAALPAADIATVANRLTEAAVAAVGGMKRFVTKGDVVWVKPNIGWNSTPELAADTNPQVVATLVRLCLDAGAKTVKVGDNPCHPAQKTYAASGIADAARAAGAQVVFLDENRFKDVALAGERLQKWPLYPEIIDADLVINVPVAKHHGLTGATLCMKNYMGVAGGRREVWHQGMTQCLCDITAFMKPRLTVLDAVRILNAHGPTGGDPQDVSLTGTVAAGTDILALDAFGVTLLGREAAEFGSIRAGEARGLGRLDYKSLALKELTLS